MTSKSEGSVQVSGENMHGKHHAEVLIMMRDADGPGGAGDYFNSLGVVDDVPDDEFDARFRALDPEELKKEYGGDGVRFNGPRRFLADRFTAQAFNGGKLSMLGPIPMYTYGTFVVPDFDAFIAGKQAPYRETVSRRTTTWFFDAGAEVYELVSPEGTVFVMQSASLMSRPRQHRRQAADARRSPVVAGGMAVQGPDARRGTRDGGHLRRRPAEHDRPRRVREQLPAPPHLTAGSARGSTVMAQSTNVDDVRGRLHGG